ncbi:MAG TPA: SDR family oxidoreductase [Nevskia sp.]|nr:SDR family oxidoreductase [Nevskia sp.]
MPQPQQFWRRLDGKVVIVTGAGSQGAGFGTGKAISCLFAREGARVCLVDRERARAEETLTLIRAAGGDAFVCAADVTRAEDCARCVQETLERYGALHALVNNVGIGAGGGKLEQIDEALWDKVFDINLRSVYLMCRQAMPHLAAARGALVNIASIAGLRALGAPAYGSSKAALVQLTRELALVYGRDGVRANAIAPGHLFTPLVHGMLDEAARRRRSGIAPLGAEGDAWDVAAAALFLASDEARFISGTCLPVDGGVTATGALAMHEMMLKETQT